MPTYSYQCPECGYSEDIRHSMDDLGIYQCPACTHPVLGRPVYLRRVFSAVPAIFRGGGWASKS